MEYKLLNLIWHYSLHNTEISKLIIEFHSNKILIIYIIFSLKKIIKATTKDLFSIQNQDLITERNTISRQIFNENTTATGVIFNIPQYSTASLKGCR